MTPKNVFFRGIILSGGAPNSAYQYIKILKEEGNQITAVVQDGETKLRKLYTEKFDKILFLPDLGLLSTRRKFFQIFCSVCKEYRILKQNKSDMVIILGHFNAFFYSQMCNSLEIPAVTLIAGGDLTKGDYLLKHCRCEQTICFSQENRDVLLEYFEDKSIFVISNRIEVEITFDDFNKHYSVDKDDSIHILLTSRISDDKYDSIIKFIALADKACVETRGINLTIAGDGDCFNKLKESVASLNNPYLNIELKGHVDDLTPEFEKAHIVVGKGRSVIEPIMMNRIGCVMGDDGKIEVCTTNNFENLYHYNFSGRNLNCDNPEAVLKGLIDSIVSGSFNKEEMLAASDITRKYYSSEYLADKFHYVLDNMKCEKRRKKRVSVLWLVLKLIWIKTWIKIRRRKTK